MGTWHYHPRAGAVNKRAGRIGIREVNVGEFLRRGATVVNLQNAEVLFVGFSLPEADLPLLQKKSKVETTTEACPGKTFAAFIIAVSDQVGVMGTSSLQNSFRPETHAWQDLQGCVTLLQDIDRFGLWPPAIID